MLIIISVILSPLTFLSNKDISAKSSIPNSPFLVNSFMFCKTDNAVLPVNPLPTLLSYEKPKFASLTSSN